MSSRLYVGTIRTEMHPILPLEVRRRETVLCFPGLTLQTRLAAGVPVQFQVVVLSISCQTWVLVGVLPYERLGTGRVECMLTHALLHGRIGGPHSELALVLSLLLLLFLYDLRGLIV